MCRTGSGSVTTIPCVARLVEGVEKWVGTMESETFAPGTSVTRELEGLHFKAVVLRTDHHSAKCDIQYLDDDNVEPGVCWDELQLTSSAPSWRAIWLRMTVAHSRDNH